MATAGRQSLSQRELAPRFIVRVRAGSDSEDAHLPRGQLGLALSPIDLLVAMRRPRLWPAQTPGPGAL